MIHALVIALLFLFGSPTTEYQLSTDHNVTINNLDRIVVFNSATFPYYYDRCNYRIVLTSYTFNANDIVLERNCNDASLSGVLALDSRDLTQVEY